jgi:hypothetical protein
MKAKNLIGFLASQDWPTLMHKGGAFLRELRGDGADDITAEHAHARELGKKTRVGFDQIGRKSIGCVAPNPCTCSYCTETEIPE